MMKFNSNTRNRRISFALIIIGCLIFAGFSIYQNLIERQILGLVLVIPSVLGIIYSLILDISNNLAKHIDYVEIENDSITIKYYKEKEIYLPSNLGFQGKSYRMPLFNVYRIILNPDENKKLAYYFTDIFIDNNKKGELKKQFNIFFEAKA